MEVIVGQLLTGMGESSGQNDGKSQNMRPMISMISPPFHVCSGYNLVPRIWESTKRLSALDQFLP